MINIINSLLMLIMLQVVMKNRDIKLKIRKAKSGSISKTWGQSSVEFVLVFPILVIVILFISQLGYLVYLQNTLEQAAREAARVISTTNSNSAAYNRISGICESLDGDVLTFEISPAAKSERMVGDTVRVTLNYRYPGLLNFLNTFTDRYFMLESTSTMRMESN